jgi:hypothetical protein
MEHKSTYIQKLPQMIIIQERESLKFIFFIKKTLNKIRKFANHKKDIVFFTPRAWEPEKNKRK